MVLKALSNLSDSVILSLWIQLCFKLGEKLNQNPTHPSGSLSDLRREALNQRIIWCCNCLEGFSLPSLGTGWSRAALSAWGEWLCGSSRLRFGQICGPLPVLCPCNGNQPRALVGKQSTAGKPCLQLEVSWGRRWLAGCFPRKQRCCLFSPCFLSTCSVCYLVFSLF